MMNYIKKFRELSLADIDETGRKNALLGEMIGRLAPQGIRIPDGFAVTASAFRHFIAYNKLDGVHEHLLSRLNREDFSNLKEIAAQARELILHVRIPNDLAEAILLAYHGTFDVSGQEVAVRSSATAQDLPDAGFAGRHDSYLNIKGDDELLEAVKKCFASLYTDRAIKYREDMGFDHSKVYLSVGIQKMVRSDKACSGIGFIPESGTGFQRMVHLAGVWGLGENLVQGTADPDEFLISEESLRKNKPGTIRKKLGRKQLMMVYPDSFSGSALNLDTPEGLLNQYVLTEGEVRQLAEWALIIEAQYQRPVAFEWAKDGINGRLYILQVRLVTVHSRQKPVQLTEYHLTVKKEATSGGQVKEKVL